MNIIFCLLWCCLLWCISAKSETANKASPSFTRWKGIRQPLSRWGRSWSNVHKYWFDQKLDHFNYFDTRTWKQKYLSNSEHYKPGGPVFLLMGGVDTIWDYFISEGAIESEYAKTFNAMCFHLEHRNVNTTNLAYLNTNQVLADLEAFIKDKSRNELQNAKWIIFGGSYAGRLAAMSRIKYPQLIHGAVSSGGMFKAKLEYKKYYTIMEKTLSNYNPKCAKNIKQATLMMSDLLKTNEGAKYVFNQYRTCNVINITNNKNIEQFFQEIADTLRSIIQYNRDSKYYGITEMSIDTICDIMLDRSLGNELDRYAAVYRTLKYRFNHYSDGCASDSYQLVLSNYAGTSWNNDTIKSGDKQWLYQTCTEFGNFLTSDGDNKLFGRTLSLNYLIDLCADVFGKSFNLNALKKSIAKTNMMYQDLKTKTSRVIYLDSSFNPWNGLGITEPKGINSTSIFIEGVSTIDDLYESIPREPSQLTNARKTVISYLKKWLS